jgi:NADH-quinone oxidoreductase subunit N
MTMLQSFSSLQLMPALPEIVLLTATLALLMLGLFARVNFKRVMLLAKMILAGVLVMVCATPAASQVAFQGLFISDAFAIFMKVLALGAALIVLMISRKSLASEDIGRYEYPVLVLFATLGMLTMISANDLMSLFLGVELQSLSLYIITALRRDHEKASEAGMKYFVLGALSTGLLLYGCSLIYGYTGSTNFASLAKILATLAPIPVPLIVGIAFLMAGLVFKISAVPFHMWTPDVYEGAPASVTAFLASAPKIAGFAVICRVLVSPMMGALPQWQPLLAGIAVASMAVGAFAGLNQRNIKRLLAYSAVGNMGYALVGVCVGTEAGVTAALLYVLLYLIMIVGAFAGLLNITRRSQETEAISDLKGLVRVYPGTAFILSFLFFSLAGIPPLAGFLGKLYIFEAAVSANFYFLAIVGVLTSVIAAAYYLWIVKVMLMDEPDLIRWADHSRTWRREPAMTFVLLGTVGGLLWIFIMPGTGIKFATDAAAALFAPIQD